MGDIHKISDRLFDQARKDGTETPTESAIIHALCEAASQEREDIDHELRRVGLEKAANHLDSWRALKDLEDAE